ncbi:MAG: hypothetical protein QOC92_2124 [Acidimicrobiaceae bacterium]|jgi:hypothetical protein
MTNEADRPLHVDLGVPAARNARIYALAGLAITGLVGLFLWDLLGLILGLPLALTGLVRGASSMRSTRAYPNDRRAATTAVAAGVVAFVLVIPIMVGALDAGGDGVDCQDKAACREHQGSQN